MSDLQAHDRLRAVSVVAVSPYIGEGARRALARAGCANVRTMTLRQVAAIVAGRRASGSQGALTGVLEGAAIRQALRKEEAAPLARAAYHRGLRDGLGALFRELRHLYDPAEILEELATRGTVAHAAATTYSRYVGLTDGFYDVPALALLAADAAEEGPGRWADRLGALVLYLPSRLDDAEVAMLGRLGHRVPIVAGLPHLGEPAADALMADTARRLATALGTTVEEPATAPSVTPDLDLISAPDPAEEARAVVRRVIGDLEAGVPLPEIAVVYTGEDSHGGLVREALDAALLPWHATTGRPLSACWAARSLLGLLALPERRFARESVLEWLAGRPPAASNGPDVLPSLSVSVWDRLSREAQVVEGRRQWTERLRRLAHALGGSEQRDEDGDRVVGRAADPASSDAAAALVIAQAIERLGADVQPPEDGASWDAFVDWAADLRARYVPVWDGWTAAERSASDAVDAALESLREARLFERGTSARTFRDALAAIIESRRQPEGVVGRGIALGTIGSILGVAFRRVYLLGLTEGAFPSRPSPDPFVDTGHDDPLGRRERAREGERRAFLGALAAGDGGAVTASYARSDGAARATYPSPWLLELASRQDGVTIYASDMPTLLAVGRPWLMRVASAQDGVTRVANGELQAADLADRRLAGLVAWRAAGGDMARHPIAARPDLPLGAALRAARARRSHDVTAYDGGLAELAGHSKLMVRAFAGGRLSASSLERWARCPFQFLLVDVLRVNATRRPEDEWALTAVDRGDVVHRILERLFRELHADGRLRGGDRIGETDHDRLDEIAAEVFAELERDGRAGHPLAWENAKTAIVADLHEYLERDQARRDADGLVPTRFERAFGRPSDTASWPAVTVALADGRAVTFSGVIDRIDVVRPNGAMPRARIVDYKSGGAGAYRQDEDDPLWGGRHVQLAIYAEALRSRLDGAEPWRVEAEFRFVTARGEFKSLSVDGDEALGERLRRVVRWAADGVGDGIFLAVPGARDRGTFVNCAHCDYDRVCSTTREDAWERKRHRLPLLDRAPDA